MSAGAPTAAVAVAGGHGAIARLLQHRLREAGRPTVGLVRAAEQVDALRAEGLDAARVDLEQHEAETIAEAIAGCDALVFAAGAGPGSGAARKETVDRRGAERCTQACRAAGVRRFVMVSAMGAADPPDGDDVFSVYLRAKAAADRALAAGDLDWTIVRPGRLTDEPGTGLVAVAERLPRGEVPRADVAEVLSVVLDEPATVGRVLSVTSGPLPVAEAVRAAVAAGR